MRCPCVNYYILQNNDMQLALQLSRGTLWSFSAKWKLHYRLCRHIAQAVLWRLFTWRLGSIRQQPVGLVEDRLALGKVFSEYFQLFLLIIVPSVLHPSGNIRGFYSGPTCGLCTKGFSFTTQQYHSVILSTAVCCCSVLLLFATSTTE